MEVPLYVKRLVPEAKLPTRAYVGDAGWDLYSIESKSLARHCFEEFRTGIAVEIPTGYYGQIAARSSSGKKGMIVHPGVIDSGYRGEISLFIRNLGMDVNIVKGDKIAQMLILPVPASYIVEVEELTKSARGLNAMGSSGR